MKQRTVALSSTEAEFMAMTEAVKESLYLKRLFEELGLSDLANVTIYNDNLGALKLAENPIFYNRSKHIDIRLHFIRETVNDKLVNLKYLDSNSLIADLLTKGLVGSKLKELVRNMGLRDIRSLRGSVGDYDSRI